MSETPKQVRRGRRFDDATCCALVELGRWVTHYQENIARLESKLGEITDSDHRAHLTEMITSERFHLRLTRREIRIRKLAEIWLADAIRDEERINQLARIGGEWSVKVGGETWGSGNIREAMDQAISKFQHD